MKLVTLESIWPPAAKELLSYFDLPVLPTPVTPAPTGKLSAADEIAIVLSKTMARMRIAQRNAREYTCIAASWIDMLRIPERQVIHDLVFDLTAELDRCLHTGITEHVIVVVKIPVHECFERLLEAMEARDLVLCDVYREDEFLSTLCARRCSAFYPISVKTVHAAPCMVDNVVDLIGCAALISNIIST